MELVYTPAGGAAQRHTVFDFVDGGGVALAMYNTDKVGGLPKVYLDAILTVYFAARVLQSLRTVHLSMH